MAEVQCGMYDYFFGFIRARPLFVIGMCSDLCAGFSVLCMIVRWAFEQRNEEITKMLMKAGVPHTDKDATGKTPVDLLEGNS